jgi:RHS repeat-associated protein
MTLLVGKALTVGTLNEAVGYGYTNGDLTALSTPSGQAIAYSYNSNHQVTGITINGNTLLSGVTYEPFGGVNGWTWGDSTAVSRSFNGDGLISQIVTAGVTFGYTFDNANRITGISDSSNSALTWSYGYDVLDRLTSASTSAASYGWTYDANGNRTAQTTTNPTAFAVSATSNQLADTTGSLVRTYSYDAAGHTTAYGSYTFSYNNRGRMSAAESTSYLYNALGQMYEKAGSAGTTYLVNDEAGHLIGEYNSSGGLIEETVWLGDIPVATLQPNGSGGINIFYIHTDHLNAPRKISQPTTGTLAWRWDTDPFGTAAPNQNPGGLGTFVYNLRFPGQYYQSETGLNQNVNRDYDPLTARYIESDPIGLAGGSYSPYIYCNANPVTQTDDQGQAVVECAKAIVELNAATANVELRLAEMVACGSHPDAGHIKALQQAVNRLETAYGRVFKHCGKYVGAAAALAAGAAALAEASVVIAAA